MTKELVNVRDLEVDDVFTIALILAKVSKGSRLQMAGLLAGKKADPAEVGIMIMSNLLLEAEDDVKGFLAGLAGKTKAEFGKLPAGALLDTIEGLIHQESAKDFLSRALRMVNLTSESKSPSPLTQSSTDTGGQTLKLAS